MERKRVREVGRETKRKIEREGDREKEVVRGR